MSACSDRCRAAKSRQGRVPLPVAEVQEMRARLTAVQEALYEVKATLERYGQASVRGKQNDCG